MNGTTDLVLGWCLHTLLGGGALLLLAWLLMRWIAQPARRQRLAEWALAGALLLAGLSLAPSWWNLSLPWPSERGSVSLPVPQGEPVAAMPETAAEQLVLGQEMAKIGPELVGIEEERNSQVAADNPETGKPVLSTQYSVLSTPHSPLRPALSAAPETWNLVPWLLGLYAAGSALLLGRWLLGHLGLARLLRSCQPAPAVVRELCTELCGDQSLPRLLVSPRVRVPFSFGLLRPTIVLPLDLSEEKALRWVLAHELAHLERRDAWACLLFGLGQVVYFVLPWFWWLRRQVRLCQEYVADAQAAAGQPEDYAQLLVGWSHATRLPVGVTGVSGPSSDLYRRITMLLQSNTPVEKRCPRSWSLLMAAGLLGLSVVVAGVGLKAVAAPVPEQKKDEPKKDEPKKDEAKKDEPKKDEARPKARVPDPFEFMPDFDRLFENLPGANPEQLKQMREEMKRAHEQMRKAMEQGMRFQAGPFGGMMMMNPGFRDGQLPQGRLGVRVEQPSDTLVEQLDLPRNQGLVVDAVMPDSAAGKAGLKTHDILLEVNGKAVPSNVGEFVKQVGEIKANTLVDVVVLRKGKKETLKGLTLPEAKVEKPQPFGGFGGGNFRLQGFGPGGKGVMMQTSRNGDEFTIKRKEGDLAISITGKVTDGNAVPSAIEIDDGNGAKKYESLEKVPEAHRDTVKSMLESVTGKAAKPKLQQF